MDAGMIKKIDEVRSLLTDPGEFDKIVAKYEADPCEETLRAVIDQMTVEIAKGRVKGMEKG
ncbi:hypothetical protein [Ekhidna sp.]|uniref:hypothetical protein n=1 Tax=Ekhidna sp. TaxID=2608089 RepID=UPI0032EC7CA4